MNNWFDYILFHMRSRPEQPAIVMEDRVVTYEMLRTAMERCAGRIAGLNATAEEPVAVLVKNPLRHFTLCLALFRIGIPSLSLEHSLGTDKDLKLATVLSDNEAKNSAADRVVEVTDEWFRSDSSNSATLPKRFSDGNQTCHLSPTSGTTGAAKLLKHTVADIGRRVTNFTAVDWKNVLCMPGLSSNFGFSTCCAALTCGRTLCFSESPFQAARMIELFSIDFVLASTEQLVALTRVARKSRVHLTSLRTLWIGGSVPSRSLLQAASIHVCNNILCGYGASERGLVATASASEVIAKPGLAGNILPGIEVAIVDQAGKRCSPGEVGAVNVRRIGDGAGEGPWADLGDVGWIAPDGQLYVTGRTTDIDMTGAKVSPVHEIEHLTRLEWDATDAAAVLLGVVDGKPQISVGIVDSKGADASILESIARAHGIDCTVKLVDLKAIPRAANGKVDRAQLKAVILATSGVVRTA